ncbi:MAG: prephenate dehydrogenase [Candidatus Omnitrophica bacterium]|nr:prephenate dehydrogenase [Candidatus Omnitrophota bacterium]
MSLFNKTVIIGTGLIGSSLGFALKKKRLVSQVTGLSRHRKNARLAKGCGAIDRVGKSLGEVKDADLLVLATPVNSIIDIALKVSKRIKKGCVVIDVGSTKGKIVSAISRAIPNFIGCHPLSGSEKRGAVNLQPEIFKDSICIITPTVKTDKKILSKIVLLWRKLGSRVVILSPEEHDQILAFTSHLPHAVAFSLMGCIPDELLSLSSRGLKDTTRISAADPNLWSEVFLSNRRNLLSCISAFQEKLAVLKLALKRNDKMFLSNILVEANKKRERLG